MAVGKRRTRARPQHTGSTATTMRPRWPKRWVRAMNARDCSRSGPQSGNLASDPISWPDRELSKVLRDKRIPISIPANFHSCQFPFLYVINPKSGAGAAFNLPLSGRLSPTEILKHRRIKLSLNIILNSRVPPAGGGAVGKEPDAVDRLESGGGGLLSCAFGEEFRRRSVARDGWLCRTAADGAGGREPDRCGARRAQPGAQGDEVFARDQPP
jgi:hypothetical protein